MKLPEIKVVDWMPDDSFMLFSARLDGPELVMQGVAYLNGVLVGPVERREAATQRKEGSSE